MAAVLLLLACVAIVVMVMQARGQDGRAMVIVEPRAHPLLPYVIANFDATVDPRYTLYVFHGPSNKEFARDAASHARRRPVRLVAMTHDNLTAGQYNALLKSPWFYDQIHAEHILVFQTDAAACGASPHRIAEFEKYGYVGCAHDDRIGRNTHWGKAAFYGVGGLSLRRKSSALECIRREGPNTEAEDVFFSNCVDKGYGTKPENGPVLQAFCSQSMFGAHSFGVHQPTLMRQADIPAFTKYCPEAIPLLE